MLHIIEALKEKSADRLRDVLVPVTWQAEPVHCKLVSLGDYYLAVATAVSYDEATKKTLAHNPRINNTFPHYKDIVEYLMDAFGKFFFKPKELEDLLNAGQYEFHTLRVAKG